MWCIPPQQNADFVAKMEDVLDVYKLPYNGNCPVICIDEKPYQLLDECRDPLPMKKGTPQRIDNEYVRCGTSSIFVMTEPLTGWYHAHARECRTKIDFALEVENLFVIRPELTKIRLVMDNLNTHVISSFYEAFEPKKARELVKKIEIHYTPKHGSWLNIAEIAISVLSKQCLNRRIPTLEMLNSEIATWENWSNAQTKKINWQFTTDDARIKLKTLYPVI
jgi:hypothetical protein